MDGELHDHHHLCRFTGPLPSADGTNARGYWADQLDPQYLSLDSSLDTHGHTLTTALHLSLRPCAHDTGWFNTTQTLWRRLSRHSLYQTVRDSFGYVANSNYNALQAALNMRASHGSTFMANYTWSRSIDDGGTFRTGYAIPAAYSNSGKAWKQDAIER